MRKTESIDYSAWGTRELIERIQELERKADKTYNGWSNYETWRVKLEIWDGHDFEDMTFKSVDDLASYIEEQTEEVVSNYGEIKQNTFAYSYALQFIQEVDYHEIAQSFVDDNSELIKDDNSELIKDDNK